MCGIVGAVRSGAPVTAGLLEGLRVLEYRGYDSAGLATAEGNTLRVANRGQQSARMVSLALKDGVNAPVTVEGASLHYVHGGSWLEWTLPAGCPQGPLTLQARIDGEIRNAQVPATCG